MSRKFNAVTIEEMKRLLAQIKEGTEGQDPAEYVATRRDFAECILTGQIMLAEENIALYEQIGRLCDQRDQHKHTSFFLAWSAGEVGCPGESMVGYEPEVECPPYVKDDDPTPGQCMAHWMQYARGKFTRGES